MCYICNLTVGASYDILPSVIHHEYCINSCLTANGCCACHRDPQLPFCPVGAAALFAGPVRGEGGGEEEADRSH